MEREPRPLAIHAQPACCVREENLAGYQGSFLEQARRCLPVDGNLPTSTHPNLLAGDAEGLQPLAEQLSGSGLLEGIHLALPAGSSRTTVLAQPDWLRGVFQRIKACALSRRTGKEAKPEVGG